MKDKLRNNNKETGCEASVIKLAGAFVFEGGGFLCPVSEAFLQAVQENTRRYYWTGRITTKKGAVYEFGADDIVKGSGYISSQCCGSAEIELGRCMRLRWELPFFIPYTMLVDGGTYQNFVRDKAGYGLAQWTFWSRKQALWEYSREQKKSIGDLQMQLDFLWKELNGSYPTVVSELRNARSVRAASDAVLLRFERPADQSEGMQVRRAGYGQRYYEKYAGSVAETPILPESKDMTDADCPFRVRVSIPDVNIRDGAGTDAAKTGKSIAPGAYTIVEVKEGKGSDVGWGRLKSGSGWIALSYTERF